MYNSAYKEHKKITHKPLKINKFITLAGITGWRVLNKSLWFLFQNVWSFMAKDMPEHSDYPLS